MYGCVNTGVNVICTGVYGLEHEGLYALGICVHQDASKDVSDGFMSSVLSEGPYPPAEEPCGASPEARPLEQRGLSSWVDLAPPTYSLLFPQNNHLNII